MSEEKKEVKPIVLEVYKENTTITVDLPVTYVTRFNQMLLEFIPFKDQDHFNEVMKRVQEGDQSEPFSYNVTTLLSFLTLVEESARKQGHLKNVEFNLETKEQKDI
jgi:hypothetical protein